MRVPESVRAFVTEGVVRRAAEELLKLSDAKILEGLAWEELGRFYRAQLAARQFQSEWAIFAVEAWNGIWGGLLDHWHALSPDDQTDGGYDAGLGLASLLDTGDDSLWFGRIFTRGSWILYASLSAVPGQGLRMKVACEGGRHPIAFPEIAPAPDEIGSWVSIVAVPMSEPELDPSLRDIARLAVEVADQGTRPKSRPRG